MILDFIRQLRFFMKLETVCSDNNIFRLHYKATVLLLIIFTLLNSTRQCFGDPIDCIADDLPRGIMDTYCWIYSTFTIQTMNGINGVNQIKPGVRNYNPEKDLIKYHKYYQWVCFVLFIQALFFYIPRYIWKNWEGGKICSLASDLKMVSVDENNMSKRMKIICDYFQNNMHQHNLYFFRFAFCELLNFINVVGQTFMIDYFLNGEFSSYGWEVLTFQENESEIDPMSRVFPKMTKCTFSKYGPSGTMERIDGLCILPVNIINEKMYIFMWFWFVILAVLTSLALVYRLATMLSPYMRFVLLRARVRFAPVKDVKYLCQQFHLGDWFMIYQISRNVDPIAFKKLIIDLANCVREKEREKEMKSSYNKTLYLMRVKLNGKV